jgi:DNA gyrase subunit A
MGGEQKFKEGDSMRLTLEGQNRGELLFFSDKQEAFKLKAHEFDDSKASVMGDYLPTKLGMEEGNIIFACVPGDYSGSLLFLYENGKGARVALSCYDTKSNRRRLTGAYSGTSPLVAVYHLKEDKEIVLYSSVGRALIVNTAAIAPKTTRTAQGVSLMSLKNRAFLTASEPLEGSAVKDKARYRTRNIPAAGALLKESDRGEEQLQLES